MAKTDLQVAAARVVELHDNPGSMVESTDAIEALRAALAGKPAETDEPAAKASKSKAAK